MTTPISDEQLVAFLHAQLTEDEMAAVEAALSADPGLAERAEMLAQQDDDIRDAFAPVLHAPVPDRLSSAATMPGETGTVIDFQAAKSRRASGRWGFPQWGAMAASLALGLVAGQSLLDKNVASSSGSLVMASADGLQVSSSVADVLSASSSGQSVAVEGLGAVTVAITFRAEDARVCRQFSLRGEGHVDDAVACRDGAHWTLEALGRRPGSPGDIRTASGDAARPVVVAVDALITGEPLVGEAEAEALR